MYAVEDKRITTHLEGAVATLRANDRGIVIVDDDDEAELVDQQQQQREHSSGVRAMNAKQWARRQRLIDDLVEYISEGVFPRNVTSNLMRRTPEFVDRSGRHCAVARLMTTSGDAELVAAVDAECHNDTIHSIVGDATVGPHVVKWANHNGFTADELQRIQPGYGPAPFVMIGAMLFAAASFPGLVLTHARYWLRRAAHHYDDKKQGRTRPRREVWCGCCSRYFAMMWFGLTLLTLFIGPFWMPALLTRSSSAASWMDTVYPVLAIAGYLSCSVLIVRYADARLMPPHRTDKARFTDEWDLWLVSATSLVIGAMPEMGHMPFAQPLARRFVLGMSAFVFLLVRYLQGRPCLLERAAKRVLR
eukprot:TRINITY_DN6624_c0_g1_i1.p1 TRINITY_DN6624_c0_g1~~TRINITY_DN6624_c0_g1_i1.p1  ORF type:complete len:361 (-),score=120.74 TRINITY_DN6624_c0_g1_i1:198-1280(-)